MIAWYWLIVAFVIGSVFTTITDYWFDYENILTAVLAAIAIPFVWIALFPIQFWKNVFHPVSQERVDKMSEEFVKDGTSRYYHVTNNIILWHDPDANRIQSKWFLVRIKGSDSK